MSEDFIAAADAYAYALLAKWEEIIDLSEQLRHNLIKDRLDNDIFYVYIAKLSRLWLELYPKIHGAEAQYKEFVREYEQYESLCDDPAKLATKEGAKSLFKMEKIVGMALEKLGITQFEK
jgi:hypothetical protein